MNIVENAKKLAKHYHKGQLYGDMPYVEHLWEVYNTVMMRHGNEHHVMLATALLHDILEDTTCTAQEVCDTTSLEVMNNVVALTKIKGESHADYIAKVCLYPVAREVKIADTLCNLNASYGSGHVGRIKKYSKQLLMLVEG